MVVDVFKGAILEVLSYNNGTQDYEIVSFESQQDGSINVVMKDGGSNSKTYRMSVTYLGYTDYVLEMVEIG